MSLQSTTAPEHRCRFCGTPRPHANSPCVACATFGAPPDPAAELAARNLPPIAGGSDEATSCATCKELPDPAFDRATVEPQLPAPYAPVYCSTCHQVNRATGLLIGLERAYVWCCVALCGTILERATAYCEHGYYCPRHTPAPPAPTSAPACVADLDLRNPDGSFIPCPCPECQRYQDDFRRSVQAIHNNRLAHANGMPSTTELANAAAELAARGLPPIAGGSDDDALYCRHNGHYCPGCSCECHAPTTLCPHIFTPNGNPCDFTDLHAHCAACQFWIPVPNAYCADHVPAPTTHAAREATQRADEAETPDEMLRRYTRAMDEVVHDTRAHILNHDPAPQCATCDAYGYHAPDRHPTLAARIQLALTGDLPPMGGGSGPLALVPDPAMSVGFYYTDAEGLPWSTVEYVNSQGFVCAGCGVVVTRGYANGHAHYRCVDCVQIVRPMGGGSGETTIASVRTLWKEGVEVRLSCGHVVMLGTEANLSIGQVWHCPDCPRVPPMGGGSGETGDFHTSTATEWFHCDRCHASVFRGQTYWFLRFAGVIDQLCERCGNKRRTDIALANVAKAVGAESFHIIR